MADLVLEGRLLGCIMVHPDTWAEVAADFQPDMFSDLGYREVAQIMVDLTNNDKKISTVSIYREMEKRGLALSGDDLRSLIDQVITPKETKALMEELIDLYKRRTVYQTLTKAISDLQSDDKPTDELIAEAQQAMVDAFTKTGANEPLSMQEVAQKMFETQTKIQAGEEPPTFPFSLAGLQTLAGGVEKGFLIVMAGRPSMGKTSFLLSEAIFWARQGYPGVIFSLEQKDTQIGRRSLANVQTIPVNYLRKKLDDHYLNKFHAGLTELSELPLKISDRRGLTADQICSLARVEKMRNPNLHWIAVDYLQVVGLDRRHKSRVDGVGDIVLKLRNLGEEIDVWVVLLSQLNRGVESRDNKRPVMSDLRDSGNIEEFADIVMFLYREGYYRPNFLGMEQGDWVTELILAKNREGGSDNKKSLALFNKPYMQWTDCSSTLAERYQRYQTEASK
jgi:replicative DNA helicase